MQKHQEFIFRIIYHFSVSLKGWVNGCKIVTFLAYITSKIGTDLHTYLTEIFISLESLAECQNVGTKTETHIGTC